MLTKFTTSYFKCFEKDFTLDLSTTNGYTFNPECIKNGNVNCAIIYGYNGSGKSNLGLAIFDIIEHLTDKNREEHHYKHYINAYNDTDMVDFCYEFLINGLTITYKYSKSDYKHLVYEQLCIDGEEVVSFDRRGNTIFKVSLKGSETLNKIITDNQLSVLKYIKNMLFLIL